MIHIYKVYTKWNEAITNSVLNQTNVQRLKKINLKEGERKIERKREWVLTKGQINFFSSWHRVRSRISGSKLPRDMSVSNVRRGVPENVWMQRKALWHRHRVFFTRRFVIFLNYVWIILDIFFFVEVEIS